MKQIHAFPIIVKWDENKQKNNKLPAVRDVTTHKMTLEQIESATNVGLPIPDGVVVFDIDDYKQTGILGKIDAEFGAKLDWSAALLQTTVSGGRHYVFRLPEGETMRQGNDLFGIRGFDTRAHGKGWIATGAGYEDATFSGVAYALNFADWPQLPSIPATTAVEVKDDLETAVSNVPLELTDKQVVEYLKDINDQVDAYQPWLNVGMALHHQFGGSNKGLKIWAGWSEQSTHYDLDEIKRKWASFGRNKSGSPITFRSVIADASKRSGSGLSKALGIIDREAITAENISAVISEIPANLTRLEKEIVASHLRAAGAKELGVTKSAIIKDIGRRNVEKTPDWVKDWVFVEGHDTFHDITGGSALSHRAFNTKYKAQPDVLSSGRLAEDLAIIDYKIPMVRNLMYAPGEELFFDREGERFLNIYRDTGAELVDAYTVADEKAIELVKKHFEFLVGENAKILLDWISFVVQNPGDRVRWTILLQGPPGIGKTYIKDLITLMLGKGNVGTVKASQLNSRFTGWATGAMVNVVEEVFISGHRKDATMDDLKELITNETIQIERKGKDAIQSPNVTSYLLFTNARNAIPIDENDRRYCVLFTKHQTVADYIDVLGGRTESGIYFKNLYESTKKHTGALRKFFTERELSSDFSATEHATKTADRELLIQLTKPDWLVYVEDALETHNCEIINDSIIDTTHLNNLVMMEGERRILDWELRETLTRLGYIKVGRVRVGVGQQHHIWVKNDGVEWREVVRNYLK